ncbi:MAG: site-specific DNA-methyltransferase [Acidobacteriota bacterium]|nr:site-specific DNA-methyltransferase [Acidobacteriota bacterium]
MSVQREEKPLHDARLNPLKDITLASDALVPLNLIFRQNALGLWLYQGNCLEVLDALIGKYPEGCFDMIFADPPYFLSNGGITCHAGRMVKVDKGDWDKSRGIDENHNFNRAWLERCQKVLKPNGTIWVTGTHHVIFSVGHAMQQLGFRILNDIAWEKPNPPPNLSCRYFTHSVETVLWAAKNEKSKHVFNYQLMREQAGGKQMKTVWRIYPPLNGEKTLGKHPTQKPVSLVERCILASTNEDALVLDPFMGGGTTGIACVQTKRAFVGIEVDSQHAQLAARRIANHTQSSELIAVSVGSGGGKPVRQYKNSVRQWLIDNDYNDVAELIDEVTAEWDRQGKKTRRNWWEVLSGGKQGKPSIVEGRQFPVLRAARLRQGLPDIKGSLCRNKREKVPPVVEQVRWKGNDKKSA